MSRKRLLSSVLVLSVVALGSMFLAVRSFGRRVEKTPVPVTQGAPVQEQRIGDGDEKGMWLLVGSDGFAVKEWTVAAGEYFVVVQNATGMKELTLTIERENGERVQEIQFTSARKLWKQSVPFTAGTYIVRESTHPEWTSRITVE